ncbi:MAG TPA: HDIG domain-containing protein [Polyangiaceae bacterium]|nr:HDIG domain-containing protein [Polyangiaceae bacterium]
MSLVFAAVLTVIRVADRYVDAWVPVMGEATAVTLRVPYGLHVLRDTSATTPSVRYEHERVLVPRGTVLSAANPAHLEAWTYEALHRPPTTQRLLASYAIYLTLLVALLSYFRRFGQSRLRLLRTQMGLLVGLGLVAAFSKLLLLFTALPEFWIPISAFPLWVAASFDRRTAFLVTVVLAFVVTSLLAFDLVLLCVMLSRGMAATLLYFNRKHARQMLLSGCLAGLSAAAVFVALVVTFEGSFDVVADLERGLGSGLLACVGGGLFGGLTGALLRVPAGRLLGHVSRERLLDLSDLEQPLLQKLAREAPGTYEHSRAMANLAEQAASSIGADALLTRLGAYYHDLGKTAQCKYFVENLGPDEKSPHEELEPDVSADAIMAHVVIGTRILRQGGIPEPVVEFAYTHHGTQLVEYFWNKCRELGNPKNLDASHFRYPGMKPQTKETAILMLVDSIEAASRTIDPPERSNFEDMIQRILFTKLKQGQLDDCGLDLNDLRVISTRVAETLVNMHHHRIKYQWQAQRAQEAGVPAAAVRDSSPQIEFGAITSLVPGMPSIPPKDVKLDAYAASDGARSLPPVAEAPFNAESTGSEPAEPSPPGARNEPREHD